MLYDKPMTELPQKTIPIDLMPRFEFDRLYDTRIHEQALAKTAFYHLWLKSEGDDSFVGRVVVRTPLQVPVLGGVVPDTTALRLDFLDFDFRQVSARYNMFSEMIDGDVYLDEALALLRPTRARLRQGIIVPYDDGVERFNYAGLSISELVARKMEQDTQYQVSDDMDEPDVD